MFQFQTGAIKRKTNTQEYLYIDIRFNSKLVRLKVRIRQRHRIHEHVSIPNWCD